MIYVLNQINMRLLEVGYSCERVKIMLECALTSRRSTKDAFVRKKY
jgi:hypothetical protein